MVTSRGIAASNMVACAPGSSPTIRAAAAFGRLGVVQQPKPGSAVPLVSGPRQQTPGLRSRREGCRRVSRLEQALAAMGDYEGPQVEGIRSALDKAKKTFTGSSLRHADQGGSNF